MDIKELNIDLGSLKAPEFSNYSALENKNTHFGIMDKLKQADLKSKAVLKRFYLIYFGIAICYFALFTLNPDQDLSFSDRINGTLLFIGILLFAIFGKIKYTEMRSIDYNLPTRTFLVNALNRYKFWPEEMNYLLLVLFPINVGSCRSFILNYPVFDDKVLDVIAFELLFVFVMSIALFFGYRHWKAHKKPFADEIKQLLNE